MKKASEIGSAAYAIQKNDIYSHGECKLCKLWPFGSWNDCDACFFLDIREINVFFGLQSKVVEISGFLDKKFGTQIPAGGL